MMETIVRDLDDLAQHQSLVEELVTLFKNEGFEVSGADGVEGYYPPQELRNDGYGDQEDKTPDVFAYDPVEKRSVIGEAKTGKNDLETEHALTQYNVYLDQFHRLTGHQAMLYVIVPSSIVPEFNTLITHYIHPDYWRSIVLVSSMRIAG
jgi:hypothetical protein